MLVYLKKRAETLPPSVGHVLSRAPFSFRLGPKYSFYRRQIDKFEALTPAEAEARIVRRLRRVVNEAFSNVPFYQKIYTEQGIDPDLIRSLDDFRSLPIVTKDQFRAVSPQDRFHNPGLSVNTGGTSGQPLAFQLERSAFAKEWAHMHHLWYARGYRKEDLKLTFRGKHFELAQPIRYNAVHNELIVNAGVPMGTVVEAVCEWGGAPIQWIHGYPSLVAEFAKALRRANSFDRNRFRSKLRGVLLGSEYPVPLYREAIETELSVNVLSWYGHSEMSVLAGETARGLYRALPTYGFAEAVEIDNSGRYRLVATSFDNLSHPFIRYDTGDVIEPVSEGAHGLVFRIAEGRVGDFIYDKDDLPHSLTAVIFGRHHAAFSRIEHVQVYQGNAGRATLLVTVGDPTIDRKSLRDDFDLSGLNIEWDVELLSEPVRSVAGKIKLKVDSKP